MTKVIWKVLHFNTFSGNVYEDIFLTRDAARKFNRTINKRAQRGIYRVSFIQNLGADESSYEGAYFYKKVS